MKIIRETFWEVSVKSKQINKKFSSAKRCKLSDQLKTIGVIIEGDLSVYKDDLEYTITIKADV